VRSEHASFDGSILLALQRATHVTLHAITVRLTDLGLTPAEINAIANLPRTGAVTASKLGSAMGSKPSSVTSILDRLEGRGLVVRGPRPGDRRAVNVSLTGAGRTVAQQVSRAVREVERHALRGLSAAQVTALSAGLAVLSEAGR
jgi:DNA-binding MarR family transcriptional regulator